MGGPFAENEFHAPGVEPVMVNACKGVFNQFIANYRVLGWRLTITDGPHDGWTAEIVDPDGVAAESYSNGSVLRAPSQTLACCGLRTPFWEITPVKSRSPQLDEKRGEPPSFD